MQYTLYPRAIADAQSWDVASSSLVVSTTFYPLPWEL